MSLYMIPESIRAWEEVDTYIRGMYGLPQPNRSKRLIKNPQMHKVLEEKLVELKSKIEKDEK